MAKANVNYPSGEGDLGFWWHQGVQHTVINLHYDVKEFCTDLRETAALAVPLSEKIKDHQESLDDLIKRINVYLLTHKQND
jgi:hypothetical protein